jgi:hypothetical protein
MMQQGRSNVMLFEVRIISTVAMQARSHGRVFL